jgi:gluconolactonase
MPPRWTDRLRKAVGAAALLAVAAAAAPMVASAPSIVASAPAIVASAPAPLDIPAYYPEGPAVIDGAVHWAEMTQDRIRRARTGTAETVWERKGCGPTAVRPTPSGEIWVLCHLANAVLLLGPDWTTKKIYTTDDDGHRFYRPNDGKVDRTGTLYFSSAGDFSVQAPANGHVVALHLDGTAQRIAGPYHYTNGISVTPDGRRLYVSEHLARRVWALDLNAGKVTAARVFFDLNSSGLDRPRFPEAGPDGQWLSPSGELFVAEYGAGRILRLGPDGRLRGTLKVKTPYVTNMVPAPGQPPGKLPGQLVVTGTYDIFEAQSRGAVFQIKVPPLTARP